MVDKHGQLQMVEQNNQLNKKNMPSTDYTFDRDMLYINDNKKTGTKLDKGLHLAASDPILWYEMDEMQEFLDKCEELNITPEINE